MLAALKSEFRKLLTVRSTYILVGFGLLFVIFYAGYIEGYRLTGNELRNADLFNSDVVGALTSLPLVLAAIVAILSITHEYRYNTIMYTLTASNSRTKVLLAKLLTFTMFAVAVTILIGVLSPAVSYAGVHLHGHSLIAQHLDYGSLIWRSLFNGWGYIVAALLLAVIIRNQVGAIVSLFAIPTAEQVLGLLLKNNRVYLPFSALDAVMTKPERGAISFGHAAAIFGAYLLVGWLMAWLLFVRRDAN